MLTDKEVQELIDNHVGPVGEYYSEMVPGIEEEHLYSFVREIEKAVIANLKNSIENKS